MLPSWLKTTLIVGGIVAVVGAVVFLWLLVKGADMRRRKDNQENKISSDKNQSKNVRQE